MGCVLVFAQTTNIRTNRLLGESLGANRGKKAGNEKLRSHRVDLRPVEIADVQEIGTRNLAETWHFQVARKKAAVDVRECIGPSWNGSSLTVFLLEFRAKKIVPITSWVLDESRALIRSTVDVNRRPLGRCRCPRRRNRKSAGP